MRHATSGLRQARATCVLIRSFLILPCPKVTRCTLDHTAGTPRRTSGSTAGFSWVATPRSSLKPTVVSVVRRHGRDGAPTAGRRDAASRPGSRHLVIARFPPGSRKRRCPPPAPIRRPPPSLVATRMVGERCWWPCRRWRHRIGPMRRVEPTACVSLRLRPSSCSAGCLRPQPPSGSSLGERLNGGTLGRFVRLLLPRSTAKVACR